MIKCKVGSGMFSCSPQCENEATYGWPGMLPDDFKDPFMCKEHFESGRFNTNPLLILRNERKEG